MTQERKQSETVHFRHSLSSYHDSELKILKFKDKETGYLARKVLNRDLRLMYSMPRDIDGPTMMIVPKDAMQILTPLFKKFRIAYTFGKFVDTDSFTNNEMNEVRALMRDK